MTEVLNGWLEDLLEFGLTRTILDDFMNLTNDFEDAITAKNNAVIQRNTDKKQRIRMGNELYNEMVIYCNIGKKLYAKTNPAKYENYLIYKEHSKRKFTETKEEIVV